MGTNDFTSGEGTSANELIEHVDLSLAHVVGQSYSLGLVAHIPAEGGGATGFVPLYAYRTFTWDGFCYLTSGFDAWMRELGLKTIGVKASNQ